jgi:hypothetical protein
MVVLGTANQGRRVIANDLASQALYYRFPPKEPDFRDWIANSRALSPFDPGFKNRVIRCFN